MPRRRSTVSPAFCLCGCQQLCTPGCRWISGHNWKATLEKTLATFWSHVHTTETCWLWTGARNKKGYGRLTVAYPFLDPPYRVILAHRFSYELTYGMILPGIFCLHLCDNPPCVRPDHLYLGSSYDNSRDMVERKRHFSITRPERVARGERHGWVRHPESIKRGEQTPMAKVTEDEVREMRRLYA